MFSNTSGKHSEWQDFSVAPLPKKIVEKERVSQITLQNMNC